MSSIWIVMPDTEFRSKILTALYCLGQSPRVFNSASASIAVLKSDAPTIFIFSDEYPYHGQTLVRMIRQSSETEVGILLATGITKRDYLWRWLEIGADDFLEPTDSMVGIISRLQTFLLRFSFTISNVSANAMLSCSLNDRNE